MQDLNDKITGNTLTADEWNQMPSELQNIIEAIGQTLSGANLNQLGIALASYISNGNFYTDSGAVNAYVLTKIGSKQAAFAYVDGMRIIFEPGNTNTGASTVNVDALGVKTITGMVGGELRANERIVLEYNSGTGQFVIIPSTVSKQRIVPADNAFSFHLNKNGANGGLYITENDSISFSRDAEYNGTNWIARETAAQIFTLSATEGLQMFSDSGLTLDATFTPTLVWEVDNTGDLTTGSTPATSAPSFFAYLSATQDDITGTDKVEFDTESWDTDGDYDPTTNFRYTPSIAGKYQVTATLVWTSVVAGDLLQIWIYKNGSQYTRVDMRPNASAAESQTITDLIEMNGTTDYIEIFALNSARNTSDLLGGSTANTRFMAHQISS